MIRSAPDDISKERQPACASRESTGGGGAPEIAASSGEIYITMKQSLRGMVERARADRRSVEPNALHAAKEALDRASVRLQEISISESLREDRP